MTAVALARSTRVVAALATCVVVGAGCAGTEVGNPVEESQLALTARSSDPDVRLGESDAGAAGTTIDDIWVVLGDLRFVEDDDCSSDRDTRVTVRGPIVAEISQGTELLTALLADSQYCRVRVPLDRATSLDGDVPAELDGHSLLLTGHRADGVPFRIRSRDKRELELRSRGAPFGLGEGSRSMIMAFDAGAWLHGIDLASAVPNAQGEVLIDQGSERALLATFEANLADSLALFRDVDADGALDASDLEVELATSR